MSISNDGIVLLAKQSGLTSFSALWQVKNALSTKKIGHTGTLDTFADGLLVALVGRLTRLVPFITDCDKTYVARVAFGVETDTLDPEGRAVKTGDFPSLTRVLDSLPSFTGEILQRPPAYSAVHVDGKRASDRARSGETVEPRERAITVHSLKVLRLFAPDGDTVLSANNDSRIAFLDLEIRCSKGTYVRSLARDIANAAHSVGHLSALRRLAIGPFDLNDAAGFALLNEFGSCPPARFGVGERPPSATAEEIRSRILPFTPGISERVGLPPIDLIPRFKKSFSNGKSPEYSWFSPWNTDAMPEVAVFCEERFLGVVTAFPRAPSYAFVLGATP